MGRLVRSGAGCGGVSHAASVPPTLWRVRTPREVWAVDVASGEGETGMLMGEIKLAEQVWILGDTGTKFALLAKKR